MQSDTTGSLQEFHKILEEAGKKGASDIHYVPKEQLRLRIDGRLVDMTEEWNKVSDSDLAMGCVIVRNDFLNEHESAVKTFIKEYAESIDYVNNNVPDAAQLVEKYEIMASAAAAEKAIPTCNIVFEDGENMKAMLNGLYDVLYNANPKAVGGSIPSEDFYYENN